MAAIPVTINGTLYDKFNRTTQQVVLIGEASITGLSIGGGPIIPEGQPPQIWGPTDPRPSNPIPIYPGGSPNPPGMGQPPTGEPPTMVKPPPPDGGWAYTPQWGWGYYPGPTQAGPK